MKFQWENRLNFVILYRKQTNVGHLVSQNIRALCGTAKAKEVPEVVT